MSEQQENGQNNGVVDASAAQSTNSTCQDGDDEHDHILTMTEAAQALAESEEEQDELIEEADALLGGEDANMCTYDQGYRTRQPLYSCRTCMQATGRQIGVCLGCSYECHEDHELVELYTKRRFKCDCGNGRCPPDLVCKFCPTKQAENDANKYNHNFDGLYCVCERPYPDPEDNSGDSMVQCCVCEDWFHTRHVTSDGAVIKADVLAKVAEMACAPCVTKLPFLCAYMDEFTVSLENEKIDVQADGDTEVQTNSSSSATDSSSEPVSESVTKSLTTTTSTDGCKLNGFDHTTTAVSSPSDHKGAAFWTANWRKQLCRCADCLKMYEQLECDYLVDPEDPVDVHVEKNLAKQEQAAAASGGSALGKRKAETSEQLALRMMKSHGIDNTGIQIEVLHEIGSLKSDITSYFNEIAAKENRPINKNDVMKFFEERKAKQPKFADRLPPDSCHDA